MKETFIKIHPSDSVAVATQEAAKGTKVTISGQTLTLRQDIPFGHKVALCDIAEGKDEIHGDIGYDGSLSGVDNHKPVFGKALNGLTDRRPADSKLLNQLFLRNI